MEHRQSLSEGDSSPPLPASPAGQGEEITKAGKVPRLRSYPYGRMFGYLDPESDGVVQTLSGN